jgi:hypothetical protein
VKTFEVSGFITVPFTINVSAEDAASACAIAEGYSPKEICGIEDRGAEVSVDVDKVNRLFSPEEVDAIKERFEESRWAR